MIHLFQKTSPDDLLTSSLYNEHTFYGAFSKDIKRATSSVVIESPYITIRRSTEFVSLLEKARNGLKVTIYTRNPYHHDGNLVSESLKGIEMLRDAGVKVIVCDDMRHRKVAIIDNTILWEGSLNMLSQNGSREIMRRTCSEVLAGQMIRFMVTNT